MALLNSLALSVLTRWSGQPWRAESAATCWAKAAVWQAAELREVLWMVAQV